MLQRGRRSMAAVTYQARDKTEAAKLALQRGRRSMAAVTTDTRCPRSTRSPRFNGAAARWRR